MQNLATNTIQESKKTPKKMCSPSSGYVLLSPPNPPHYTSKRSAMLNFLRLFIMKGWDECEGRELTPSHQSPYSGVWLPTWGRVAERALSTHPCSDRTGASHINTWCYCQKMGIRFGSHSPLRRMHPFLSHCYMYVSMRWGGQMAGPPFVYIDILSYSTHPPHPSIENALNRLSNGWYSVKDSQYTNKISQIVVRGS